MEVLRISWSRGMNWPLQTVLATESCVYEHTWVSSVEKILLNLKAIPAVHKVLLSHPLLHTWLSFLEKGKTTFLQLSFLLRLKSIKSCLSTWTIACLTRSLLIFQTPWNILLRCLKSTTQNGQAPISRSWDRPLAVFTAVSQPKQQYFRQISFWKEKCYAIL